MYRSHALWLGEGSCFVTLSSALLFKSVDRQTRDSLGAHTVLEVCAGLGGLMSSFMFMFLDCGSRKSYGVSARQQRFMLIRRALVPFALFVCSASLADYLIVMFYPFDMGAYVLIYQFLLSISGYLASLAHFLVTRRGREAISLLPVFAVGKFLAEHMFFVSVDLLGDFKGAYLWYTHNPLNPDGQWSYGWEVLGVKGTILNFALIVVAYYLPGYLVARWLMLRRAKGI